jgi:hypothetical protein
MSDRLTPAHAFEDAGMQRGGSADAEELVAFWRECNLDGPPFAHPKDWPVLRQWPRHIDAEPKDFTTFISDPCFGDFADHRFRLSLLPIPYVGDLRSADIIILLLNPGFQGSRCMRPRRLAWIGHGCLDEIPHRHRAQSCSSPARALSGRWPARNPPAAVEKLPTAPAA